jgi:hypothetical protein
METKRLLLTVFAVVVISATAHAGRWLSRDPIEEHMELDRLDQIQDGRANLYNFCYNNGISFFDRNGLDVGGAGYDLSDPRARYAHIPISAIGTFNVSYSNLSNPIDFVTIIYSSGQAVNCARIKVVQIARTFNDNDLTNPDRQWHLDPKGGSFYEHVRGGVPATGGGTRGVVRGSIGLTETDDPWAGGCGQQEFESCIVCTQGADKGVVYGGVTWKVQSPSKKESDRKGLGAGNHPSQPPSQTWMDLAFPIIRGLQYQ